MSRSVTIPANYTARPYQVPLWRYYEGEDRTKPAYGRRSACVWHRRAGKDLTALALIAQQSALRVGTYWHLFPFLNQGRQIAWDGARGDGIRFRDVFPPEYVEGQNSTEMAMRFVNGSTYRVVGADKLDKKLIGTNPIGIVISEWSVMDPSLWAYLLPILTENKGWAHFVFTPRGKNHAYRTFQAYRDTPGSFAELLTVDDTQAMTPADLEGARQELIDLGYDEEYFMQEYYCSFERPTPGSYYAKQITAAEHSGRVARVPYEPKLETFTAWDLGMSDHMAVWIYQLYGREVRLIDYLAAQGQPITWFFEQLKNKGYQFRRHYAPWDMGFKELTSGKRRVDIAREMGFPFMEIPRTSVEEGIQAVRSILPRCYFDETNCADGLDGLKQYHADRDASTGEYKKTPKHDWASHPADAFRTLAMALKGKAEKQNPRGKHNKPRRAQTEFNPFQPV